jgi:hypothetical protein
MQLVIDPSGTIRCLYDEAIELDALGQLMIRRGSHVEPTNDGRWIADLCPAGAQHPLGPFRNRSDALRAERDWLETNWLLGDHSG